MKGRRMGRGYPRGSLGNKLSNLRSWTRFLLVLLVFVNILEFLVSCSLCDARISPGWILKQVWIFSSIFPCMCCPTFSFFDLELLSC